MIEALINAFRAPDIRRRIIFVLAMLVVYRLLAVVPVPSVDRQALDQLINDQTFLQLLDLFSGGGLRSFSIVAMGVNPYINASIIMQLMQGVVPRLQALSREGEYGRTRLNQYTRYLTVPLALKASAATNSATPTSPSPRTLSGLPSPRIRPAWASVSALTATGLAVPRRPASA